MFNRFAVACLLLLACAPVLAGPREDALAAYLKFFELFTTDNHDQLAALFAPDALFAALDPPKLLRNRAKFVNIS